MRFLIGSTTASLLILGAAAVGSAPAWAEDDIYFNHAKGTMSGSAPAVATPNGGSIAAEHQYMQIDPRDTKVQSTASSDDVYFNHAKGTMSGSAPDAAPAPTTGNGNYVASYHQYMQMDPRDTKAGDNGPRDVDAANPWFNHAKGTMSTN